MKIDPKWLTGFVDAKDCFSITNHEDDKFIFEFRITVPEKDIQLLYAIKKFFGYGFVEQKEQLFSYRINKLETVFKVIIPFFERNQLLTKKKMDFLAFRDAILEIKKEKNSPQLSEESLARIEKIRTKIENNHSLV